MGQKLTNRLPLRRIGAVPATVGLLTIGFTSLFVTSTASPALATGACTAPSGTGLQKNINTSDGCDQADGQADYPITGFIAFTGAAANTTYTLEDVYQTLPDSSAVVYSGAYVLALTCSTGSGTDGSYNVAAGSSTYPSPPSPAPAGTLPTVTTNGSGDVVCSYSLTVGTAPVGDFASSRNDL